MNISLRETTPDDEPLLFEIYASTRIDELAGFGWDEKQKHAFIRMQFLARERSYPRTGNRIIVLNDQEIGRIMVARTDDEIWLKDIAILTEYRNSGIGSRLIGDLMSEAAAEGKRVRLHVLEISPAVRLYERLGFRRTGYDAAYLEMTWTPTSVN